MRRAEECLPVVDRQLALEIGLRLVEQEMMVPRNVEAVGAAIAIMPDIGTNRSSWNQSGLKTAP